MDRTKEPNTLAGSNKIANSSMSNRLNLTDPADDVCGFAEHSNKNDRGRQTGEKDKETCEYGTNYELQEKGSYIDGGDKNDFETGSSSQSLSDAGTDHTSIYSSDELESPGRIEYIRITSKPDLVINPSISSPKTLYLVSSQTILKSSPLWENINLAELSLIRIDPDNILPVLSVVTDELDALKLVLQILNQAHRLEEGEGLTKIPRKLKIEMLVSLCKISDKYELRRILRSPLTDWAQRFIFNKTPFPCGEERLLMICAQSDYDRSWNVEQFLYTLAFESIIYEGPGGVASVLRLGCDIENWGNIVKEEPADLKARGMEKYRRVDPDSIPKGYITEIIVRRDKLVRRLLKMLRDFAIEMGISSMMMNENMEQTTAKVIRGRCIHQECRELGFGSLMRSLLDLGLFHLIIDPGAT